MTTVLAIDTATDACSVALYRDGQYSELHEVIPRQHSTRLLPMLQSLLPDGNLRAQGVDALVYGSGPGSFTGLRIVTGAVQALAFVNGLPCVGVSTLACQAQTALRTGLLIPGDRVLSVLDARINEVYWSLIDTADGLAREVVGPSVCSPADVAADLDLTHCHGVGGGVAGLPQSLSDGLLSLCAEIFPSARDLVPLALERLARGEHTPPQEVLPVYVREEISWKKLAEQGRPE